MTTDEVPERQQRLLNNGIDREKLQQAIGAFGAEAVSRRLNMGIATVRRVCEEWGITIARDGNPQRLVIEEFLPTSIGRPRGEAAPGQSRARGNTRQQSRPEPLKPGIEGAIQQLERDKADIEERLARAQLEVETLGRLRDECQSGIETLSRLRR